MCKVYKGSETNLTNPKPISSKHHKPRPRPSQDSAGFLAWLRTLDPTEPCILPEQGPSGIPTSSRSDGFRADGLNVDVSGSRQIPPEGLACLLKSCWC